MKSRLPRPRASELTTALVLTVASVCVAWPLVGAAYLPFVDYPQHAAAVGAIHRAGDPAFGDFFVVEYGRSQYLLFYVASHLLAYVFGVEGGTRLVTLIGLAGLPLALAAFLRAHGRPALLGALAAGVALNTWLFWGFVSYALGITVALSALAALAYALRGPSIGRLVLFGALALACFYAHAQMYAWLVAAALVQTIATIPALGLRRTFDGAWRAILAAIPSVAGVLFWLGRSSFLAQGEASGRSDLAARVAGESARFAPVEETLRRWLSHSFAFYRDGSGVRLAALFFAVVLLLVILRGAMSSAARRAGGAAEDDPSRAPATLAPELVLALSLAAYLFAPVGYKLVEPISHRFLPVVLALLAVLGPREIRGRRVATVLAGATLVLLSIQTARLHATHFASTDAEMGELDEALARTQPGRRLLGLVFDRGSRVVSLPVYLHAHQYYQARVGGLACYSFAELPKSPIRYRPGSEPPPFPPRFEWTPERFDPQRWGAFFDYFLVRTAAGRPAPRLFPSDDLRAPRLVYEGPRWHLYAR